MRHGAHNWRRERQPLPRKAASLLAAAITAATAVAAQDARAPAATVAATSAPVAPAAAREPAPAAAATVAKGVLDSNPWPRDSISAQCSCT